MDKLKKRKLFLMVGIAGSGKSTWIQNHKDKFTGTVKVISRDEIRLPLLKDGDNYFAKENEVWKEFVNQAKKSLHQNDNTILDATHLNESSRAKILRALNNELKNVTICAIVINSKLDTAISQNSLRTGRRLVPESTIRSMYNNFTIPTLDEGFDKIYIYKDAKVSVQMR